MITDETNPGEFSKKKNMDYVNIKGWGIDADPENDPTYPMKTRTNEDHDGYTWQRPPLQPENIEILQSVERPNITATFGTSSPPSGLSGLIRRWAYKKSESDLRRWVPLLIADRVDMVEGIISDIAKGHVPNIFAERGWNAEWKYNRQSMINKMIIAAAVTGVVIGLLALRRGRSKI
jgi:hypothetical protein